MRNIKRLLALVLALVMTLSLVACGGSKEEAASNGEAEASAEEVEQVLNVRLVDLSLLDVNDARNANEFLVLTNVQEGLFRIFTDENGNDVTEYAGCTGYEVSEDGLTYTFHLREGCKWSDGVEVTAQHYVDSWLRLVDPNEAFSYAFLATGIVGADAYYNGEGAKEDVAITLVDDYTFTVTLSVPDPTFVKKVTMVCFYPVRMDLIEAAAASGADWTNDYTLHVWNGPFVISDRVRENSMTLTKNETYWNAESVKLQQINMRVVDEAATMAQLIESKQMDIITLTDVEYIEKWQPKVDAGELVRISKAAPSVTYLVVDQHLAGNGGPSGLMLSEKCRLAMSLAFDREEFNDMFYNGLNTVAYGLVPNNIVVGDTEFRAEAEEPLKAYADIAADPAKLQALFDEGLAEAGFTGSRSDVTLTVFAYTPTVLANQQLEWYKQQLESKLGVNVSVDIYPDVSTWKTARDAYEYDFYSMGWNGDFNDPMTFMELFVTGNGYAKFMGGFSDAEYDELMAKASSSQDQAERLELFKQAEKILMEKGGTIPLYYNTDHTYHQSYVSGLSMPMFGGEFDFSRVEILAH